MENNAKMREALENLTGFEDADLRQLEHLANRVINEDIYGGGILLAIIDAIREGKKALSVKPRNCDVGTAKEQAERKAEYCTRYAPFADSNCDACPLRNYNRAQPGRVVGYSCDLAWGQLPYEVAQEGGDYESK